MAIGEDKIRQAFKEQIPKDFDSFVLQRGGKIKFQFNEKWYEIDASTNSNIAPKDHLVALEDRAINAVLGGRESYPPVPEKEEKSQEYKEKLFYASCQAMQGIILGSMIPKASKSLLNDSGNNPDNWVVDKSIELAEGLLKKLDIE